jgi:hypothetical protein
MSSAGHVQDMISRMKANEAMKNSRRKTYQKIREKNPPTTLTASVPGQFSGRFQRGLLRPTW